MTNQTNLEYKLRALRDRMQEHVDGRRESGYHGTTERWLRELDDLLPPALPDPLFGARATHPDYGEGIVGSQFPDGDGDVRFMFPGDETYDGTWAQWVPPSTLTFHTPDTCTNCDRWPCACDDHYDRDRKDTL